jgi:diguanylate cyclase (GGDEF)-like protein
MILGSAVNSPPPPTHAPDSPTSIAPAERRRGARARLRAAAWYVRGQFESRRPRSEARLARILDLFEEHVYAGEITPDGRYVHHNSESTIENLLGAKMPESGIAAGDLWESRIIAEDRAPYEAFNRRLLRGEDADVTYRLVGLDGATRVLRDRARPRRRADGSMLVDGIISDITAREEAAAHLAEAGHRFTSLLDVVGAHVYLAVALPDGTLQELFQGPGGDRLLGGAEPDAEMENWDAAVHPEDRPAYQAFNQTLGRGVDAEVMYRLLGADGITRWVHDRGAVRRRLDGTFEVSGIVSDVTEQRRLEDDLRRSMLEMQSAHRDLESARAEAELRAGTDDLTGTFNRRHFVQIATEALESDPGRCGLLLLDADHFKQINDAYGHAVGDTVLVGLAQRLRSGLEPGDCLARWGGEEFAVLLRDVGSDRKLARRAERLRRAAGRTPITHEAVRLHLTISIGGALAPPDGASLDDLVDAADGCLYAAKFQGRNRVSLVPGSGRADTPVSEPEVVGMARALAFASSLREGIPEEHAEQVARLAVLTAEHLGLPVGVVLRCRLAGWLHDVGKLAIPEQILTKPGPLDSAEWKIMRTHPVIGAAIVRRVATLREAAPAVRHHHERYAGDGYPDGLAGSGIPIEARIVAAADAYAAMTATRPYSTARTPEQAAAELSRSAGTHLDPVVVEALLAVLSFGDQVVHHAA